MLVHGEERSREAAAGALYKMAQQECHKMAMCRVEGGIEVRCTFPSRELEPTNHKPTVSSTWLRTGLTWCALLGHPGRP